MPACRSLDCVSVFALTSDDAACVLDSAEGFDANDAYSREYAHGVPRFGSPVRLAVPRREQLTFFGDADYAQGFAASIARARALGWQISEIDFAPFLATAQLLYEGPWVAERYAAIGQFMEQHGEALHPVTRAILDGGKPVSAVDTFRAQHRLQILRRQCAAVWRDHDALLTPTAGTIYRIDEVLANPRQLNANLGYYTNAVNLLDLSAVAVPAGFRGDGLPFGVTLVAPAGADRSLLHAAAALHHASVATLGATQTRAPAPTSAPDVAPGHVPLVVCGAHLSGLPLNHQLASRGAHLLRATRTAPTYRLYALPGGPPARPGLIRVAEGGSAIEVEVWAVPSQQLGEFIAAIPAPLGVGKVVLEDGAVCTGFLCEPYALAGAADITGLGGWRAWLAQAANP